MPTPTPKKKFQPSEKCFLLGLRPNLMIRYLHRYLHHKCIIASFRGSPLSNGKAVYCVASTSPKCYNGGMLMHAFSSKAGGGGGAKNFKGGGGGGGGNKKIRNRAAAVTGPQRHLAALGLGDSSLYNSPRL